MRKITIFALLMTMFIGHSQINAYKFSQSNGTYTEIGGTTLGDETTDEKKFVDPAIPSGGTANTGPGFDFFNFTFNGIVYNRFGVSENGWIALGTSSINPAVNMTTSANSNTPLSAIVPVAQDILLTRISALGYNLMAQTGATLQYEIIGTAPYRTLVVQWKNYRRINSTGESFNFQIRLNETSNTINFIYGNFTAIASTGIGYQVGLRTAPATTLLTNYTNRTAIEDWNLTSTGISPNDLVKMENTTSIPPKGLTFTWTPPPCGIASGIIINNVNAHGATISWNPLPTVPSAGYEYIVSTSPTVPSVTDSGTVTTNTTAIILDKDPNTVYYIYFRSNCGTQFSQWALAGTFTTPCTELTTFTENFDNTAINTLPNCWTRAISGSGNAYVYNNSVAPATTPNRLVLYADPTTTPSSIGFAIMPVISNLQSNKNRLRFIAYGGGTGKSIDVGYFTTPNDINTYVNIKTFSELPSNPLAATELMVAPLDIPLGIKNLVFRNTGQTSGTYVYVDDVVWELDPACKDISNLTASLTNLTSVKLSWTNGSSTTNAQYVFSTTLTDDPDKLTPIDLTTNTVTLNLTAGTSYAFWVRSKCTNTSFGKWIPVSFSMPCALVDSFTQNFDSGTTLPSCWGKIGNEGTVLVKNVSFSITKPNALYIQNSEILASGVLTLPAVNNSGTGTHRLRFKTSVFTAGKKLEIGYLTDANNAGTFVSLQTFTINNANVFTENIAILGKQPTTPFIAFKVSDSTPGTILIDDVSWEPIPTCQDIQNISTELINNNSISLKWDPLSVGTTYQYTVGSSSLGEPSSLTPIKSVNNSVTISQLKSATSYKVWIRSVCHDTDFGAWMGPVMFTTTCDPVDSFVENFDASTNFTNCWNNAGTSASIINNASVSTSSPNVLSLNSSSTDFALVALKPVNITPLGTHSLKFKFRSFKSDAVLEIGYLTVPSDPKTFHLIKSCSPNQANVMVDVVTQLEITQESQVLALRNKGVPASTIYVDDVIWEPVPVCSNVDKLTNLGVTDKTLNLEWTEGGAESKWQYALGAKTVSDPNTLTPVNVDSSSIVVNDLTPGTSYKIWVRSKCNDDIFGKWIGPLNFTTICAAISDFHENFDKGTDIPNCWTKIGNTGITQISTTGNTPTLPNSLFLYSGSENSRAILAMPLLNNANKGDHRLRFKTKGSTIGAKLEVGYITNIDDPNTFVTLKTFTSNTIADFESHNAELGSDPKSQILAFRNAGNPSATIYIDDVYWEPIPVCQDVTNILVSSISINNAVLNWNSTLSNKFQYVLGNNNESDPNILTIKDINSNSITINQLDPASTHRFWLRSKCSDTSFGVWIGPLSFTTNCNPVTEFIENFDTNTNLPTCWNRSGTLGSIYVSNTTNAPSASNTLIIYSDYNSGHGLVAMPAVSNASAETHRLSFKAKANLENSRLEVGYLTNVSDPNSFVVLEVVTITSNIKFNDYFVKFTTNQPLSQTLALRTAGNDATYIYLDNIAWQPIPLCDDVVNLKIALVKSTTVNVVWNQNDSINKWQYVLGYSTDNDPNALTAVTVENYNITIDKLTPSKSYKVWLRSKCSDTNFGYWVGPLTFETNCLPVTSFTEKFDENTSLPTCWKKCGDSGAVTINTTASKSFEINSLNLFSGTTSNQGIVSMPPVSNSAAGTQKLKFKARTDGTSAILEIGYLKDTTDPKSFVSLQNKSITSTTNFVDYMIDLGIQPQSEVLAFRNSGNITSNIYIENVIWDETTIDLGVETIDSVNFTYYPNPVKNILNLSYNKNITSVSVFNLLGQEVIVKSANTDQTSIDMSDLSNGTYLVKVTALDQVKTIKVIKE